MHRWRRGLADGCQPRRRGGLAVMGGVRLLQRPAAAADRHHAAAMADREPSVARRQRHVRLRGAGLQPEIPVGAHPGPGAAAAGSVGGWAAGGAGCCPRKSCWRPPWRCCRRCDPAQPSARCRRRRDRRRVPVRHPGYRHRCLADRGVSRRRCRAPRWRPMSGAIAPPCSWRGALALRFVGSWGWHGTFLAARRAAGLAPLVTLLAVRLRTGEQDAYRRLVPAHDTIWEPLREFISRPGAGLGAGLRHAVQAGRGAGRAHGDAVLQLARL